VAHQLIDHPRGDAGVLQPGREGVAQVVGSVQVQVRQVGAGGGDRGLVDPAKVVVDSGVRAPRGMPLLPPGPGNTSSSGRTPARAPEL
jgi:hypothetical protein